MKDYKLQLIENNIQDHYFVIKEKGDKLIFKLKNFVPFFEKYLIIKHRKTGKRLSIPIKRFKAVLTASELDELDKNGIEHKLVFIYTEPDVILNRYKQTRRRHPLADSHKSLEEAIDAEYRMCQPIQEKADIEIDTTYLTCAR